MAELEELKKKLKQLDTIYIILLADQLLLFVTAYILIRNELFNFSAQYSSQIKIAIMLGNAFVIIINRILTAYITKQGQGYPALEQKFNSFRKLSLLKIAILNSVNILNTIAFLIVGEFLLAIVFGIMFLLYLGSRPTAKAFIRDFKLSGEIKRNVENLIN